MTKYEHTQIGYLLIYVLLGAAMLAGFGAIMRHDGIALAVAGIVLLTIPGFYKLRIKVDNETLSASFGIGLIRKRILIANIESCEPIRIRWWYGWGIHFTPYGLLYNVSGWNAVAIRLRNGKKCAIGTDDSQGLVEAIRRFASAR